MAKSWAHELACYTADTPTYPRAPDSVVQQREVRLVAEISRRFGPDGTMIVGPLCKLGRWNGPGWGGSVGFEIGRRCRRGRGQSRGRGEEEWESAGGRRMVGRRNRVEIDGGELEICLARGSAWSFRDRRTSSTRFLLPRQQSGARYRSATHLPSQTRRIPRRRTPARCRIRRVHIQHMALVAMRAWQRPRREWTRRIRVQGKAVEEPLDGRGNGENGARSAWLSLLLAARWAWRLRRVDGLGASVRRGIARRRRSTHGKGREKRMHARQGPREDDARMPSPREDVAQRLILPRHGLHFTEPIRELNMIRHRIFQLLGFIKNAPMAVPSCKASRTSTGALETDCLRVFAIRGHDPIAELLPFPPQELMRAGLVVGGKTAVRHAPLGELSPAVQRHGR